MANDFDAVGDKPDHRSNLPELQEDGTDRVTVLDRLAERLKERRALDPVLHVVPARPDIRLTFNPDLDVERVAFWRKKAYDKGLQDTNTLKLAVTTIVAQCVLVELEREDKEGWDAVEDEDGVALTFRDKRLLAMLGNATGALNAVRWLFSSDADILDALYKIIEGAGFARDDEEDIDDVLDPTRSSSQN